jgi:hypothetical protein
VRAARAHGHAEALGGADHDVGAQLARRHQQRERQQVGGHDEGGPLAWTVATSARRSSMQPLVDGYCASTAK